MKMMYILGAALLAMLAFSVVPAESAFATETAEWLVDGATIALTEKVNVDATVNSAGVLLEDMNATLRPDILCTGLKGLGFIYSNGEGEIVEVVCTATETMTSGVTCEAPAPINLPWLTQLTQGSGLRYRDSIRSNGKGEPGWEFTCTALGVKVTDTCASENGGPEQINDDATEEVESLFPEAVEKREEANCTVGGKEEGLIFGSVLLDALNSSGTELLDLTVSLDPEVS